MLQQAPHVIPDYQICELLGRIAARPHLPWWTRAVDRINATFWRLLGA